MDFYVYIYREYQVAGIKYQDLGKDDVRGIVKLTTVGLETRSCILTTTFLDT